LQATLGLRAGPATSVSTANGVTTAYLTRLDQLAIGDIELYDVKASIIKGMAVDEVLLGMNVLKQFELVQRGKQLIIRQYQWIGPIHWYKSNFFIKSQKSDNPGELSGKWPSLRSRNGNKPCTPNYT
jgi:hypothetical protein